MNLRHTFIVAAAVLMCCASLAHARQRNRNNNNAEQPDWMSQAMETDSVVLQLDSDPNYNRQMEPQTLVALLRSSSVTDPAIEKALGMPGPEGRKFVNVDGQVTGNRFIQLTVAIKPNVPNAKPGLAKVLINDLADRLRVAVEQSGKAANAGIEARRQSLETDLVAAKERLKKATDDLKAARAVNPNMGGNNPQYEYRNLVQQKQQIELQLVGMRARLKALTEQQPTTAPAVQSANPQPGNTWTRLVELRQKRLDELKAAEKNGSNANEIANAELALAETRAMAESLGALYRPNAFNQYPNELPALRANIAENEARLAMLNEQLSHLTPTTNADDGSGPEQISLLQQEQGRARNEVDTIQNQLSDTRRNRAGAPPTLTILDGSSTAPKSSEKR